MAYNLYLLAVVGVMRLVEWSGSPWLRDHVADWIGSAAYHLSPTKRARLRAGVRTALDPGPDQEARIVEGSFRAFWADTFGLLLADRAERQIEQAKIHGLDHLQAALERGRGVILLESGNFGQRTLCKRVLHARGHRLHQGHATNHLATFWNPGDRRLRERLLRPFFERCELRFVDEIIYLPEGDSAEIAERLLAVLRANGCLCLSGGGGPRLEHFMVEFLGQPRVFASGLANLARDSGAPLVPIYGWREDGRLHVAIEPPIEVGPGLEGSREAITVYAHQLEGYARRYPDQYHVWRGPVPGRS